MAALSIAYYNVASVQQGAQLQQDIVELSMLLRQLDSVRFDVRQMFAHVLLPIGCV
eukprot:SAG31_NODE_55_length_29938_cov_9.154027_25_plen_56_part_00